MPLLHIAMWLSIPMFYDAMRLYICSGIVSRKSLTVCRRFSHRWRQVDSHVAKIVLLNEFLAFQRKEILRFVLFTACFFRFLIAPYISKHWHLRTFREWGILPSLTSGPMGLRKAVGEGLSKWSTEHPQSEQLNTCRVNNWTLVEWTTDHLSSD